jgi:hypothetical protein
MVGCQHHATLASPFEGGFQEDWGKPLPRKQTGETRVRVVTGAAFFFGVPFVGGVGWGPSFCPRGHEGGMGSALATPPTQKAQEPTPCTALDETSARQSSSQRERYFLPV